MKQASRLSQAALKSIRKLLQKKYRLAERKFIVEGLRLVEEAVRSDWEVEKLLLSAPMLRNDEATALLKEAEKRNCPVFGISEEEVGMLSDTVTSQGILAVVSMKEQAPEEIWTRFSRQSLVVGLDGVSDPGNLGTILRTCDWFGVDAVLINRNSAELYNPKILRSAMGSIFHLPVLPDIDLIRMVRQGKKLGFRVLVTAASGDTPLSGKPFPPKTIVVFGNEAHGVSREMLAEADALLSIPKFGNAESLNVAIACGVILGSIRLAG